VGKELFCFPSFLPSQLPLERAVKDCGKHRIESDGALSLEGFQPIHLRLKGIELGDDAELVRE
jgi:hypothetical protein